MRILKALLLPLLLILSLIGLDGLPLAGMPEGAATPAADRDSVGHAWEAR